MKIIYVALITILLCRCSHDPEPVTELLVNNDMETGSTTPNGWFDIMQTVYTTEWATEEANSGTRSLKISATDPDNINIAFWYQHYAGVIPVGKDVVLSVKVKCKNVTGEGVAIAIRGDDGSLMNATQFSSTQGRISITGDFDWTTYQVRLNRIQDDIKSLTIYLMLGPNSIGTVYFDDASLIVQ